MKAKVGDTILIKSVYTDNDKDKAAADMVGKVGTIEHIDDMGQLHGTWGSLAVIPEVDTFEIKKHKI